MPGTHSVERHASLERDLAEVKFWCYSIGIKNLRDCVSDAQRSGQRCGRTPPGDKQCQHILDPYGRHAACSTKGLHTRRHDRIRDLITKLARQAGLKATTEQAMLIPDQIQSDGQPAPGSVRPIHRADVHIIEPHGSKLWLDVKIHTVAPEPRRSQRTSPRKTHQVQSLWPKIWFQPSGP